METTLKQRVLTKITALPDNTSFEDILKTLRALRPRKNSRRSGVTTPDTKEERSCFDLMQPYLGLIKDGPPDLSTNKAYLEGYGQ